MSTCMLAPVLLTSCEKSIQQPLAIVLTVPSEEISIQQGEIVDITFTVQNLPEGCDGVEVSVIQDIDLFTVDTEYEADGISGIISVKAPEMIYSPQSVNISVTATATPSGETAKADVMINAVMYDGYTEIEAPANCYIVQPGAFVKFPANIGNTAETATFTTAELLWQDTDGLVTAVSAAPESNAIYAMLAPETSGNAVIAIKDENGTTVWSYHLWITDYDPEATAMDWTNSNTSVSYTIMDRHLGALSVDPQSSLSNGLFYQWGRKDPFISSDNQGNLKTMYDISGKQVEKIIEPCGASDNITVSIANPLTHYSGVSGGDYSWLTNDPSFLASDTVKDLWGGVSGEKTKYDPCPDGWKVIPSDGWAFIKDETASVTKVYSDSAPETPSNKDMRGWMVSINSYSLYLPSQGEVQHDGSYVNGVGSTWPCGKVWSANLNEYTKCMCVGSTPSSLSANTGTPLGYELAVRCVKM